MENVETNFVLKDTERKEEMERRRGRRKTKKEETNVLRCALLVSRISTVRNFLSFDV